MPADNPHPPGKFSTQTLQVAVNDHPRYKTGDDSNPSGNEGNGEIDISANREGAEHRFQLVAARGRAQPRGEPLQDVENSDRGSSANRATLEAETEEMALKLARDVAVRSADEMQDLDDLTIACHRALSCKCNGKPHGGEHKAKEHARGNDDALCHDREMLDPEVMIVDARSRDGLGKPLAQDLEIEPLLGIEPGGDEARNGQFGEVEPSAEPGLKKLLRLRFRVGPHPSNAGHSARELGRSCRVGLEITAGRGAHLNCYLARGRALPDARGVAHKNGRASRKRGKESHNGDDRRQRAPGNRGFGHEWRLAVLGAPPSGNAEGQTHGRLNLAHS